MMKRNTDEVLVGNEQISKRLNTGLSSTKGETLTQLDQSALQVNARDAVAQNKIEEQQEKITQTSETASVKMAGDALNNTLSGGVQAMGTIYDTVADASLYDPRPDELISPDDAWQQSQRVQRQAEATVRQGQTQSTPREWGDSA